MAPKDLKRSFSSASAPARSYAQRPYPKNPNARPNTKSLNEEKLAKIRPKLNTYRIEVLKLQDISGLDAKDTSNIVAQALQGRATKIGRGPSSSAQSISGHSECSFVTDVTNDTNDTGFTITFNSRTGAEQQEKVKRQLDPVLKARKDLMRSIGTCKECRTKKVKCSLSHHALEELLADWPDAAEDVGWALQHDTDPKQADRNITTPIRNSPNGPAPLQTFAEEDVENSGAQRQNVVGQVNDMFGVGNVGLALYSQELDVDGVSDGSGYDAGFDIAENQVYSGMQVQTEFCRPDPVQHHFFRTAMQSQPFASSSSPFIGRAVDQSFAPSPRRSSNANFPPQNTHSLSRSYQSSISAPQSQIYSTNPQSPMYSPPEMQLTGQCSEFIMSPIGVDEVPVATIEPSPSPAIRRHDFRCMIETCGLLFPMIELIKAHLRDCHPEYDIVSPDPVRKFCFACRTLSYKQSTSCDNQNCINRQGMPGAQSPWLAISGKMVAISSFSIDDADMTGMWNMTSQEMGSLNFMGNSNDNTGYGHFNVFGGQQ